MLKRLPAEAPPPGSGPGTGRAVSQRLRSLGRDARYLAGRARSRLAGPGPWRLPTPTQCLADRPDLLEYDIGRFTRGHLTVSNRTPGATLRIGAFTSFAHGCHILLGGEHRLDFLTTYRFSSYAEFRDCFVDAPASVATKGDVIIGNDVWMGHQSLILSGVTIGDGAVIGAGSVVRRNVPPYTIVAGNPARVAGARFDPEQIAELLRIRWWDWPIEKIRAHLPILMSGGIDAFIAEHAPLPGTP